MDRALSVLSGSPCPVHARSNGKKHIGNVWRVLRTCKPSTGLCARLRHGAFRAPYVGVVSVLDNEKHAGTCLLARSALTVSQREH